MTQVRRLQRLPNDAPLERQGLHETHELSMRGHTRGGATLVGALADNDVGPDGPLRLVVVRRHSRDTGKRQELMVMLQDAAGQAAQGLVVIRGGAPGEQARLQPLLPSLQRERRQRRTLTHQALRIEEDPAEAPMGTAVFLGELRLGAVAQLPQQMHPALLLGSLHPIVGAVEVADHDARVGLAQHVLGDPGPSAAVDVVVGESVGDEGPEPVVDARKLPARLIDMGRGARADRLTEGVRLDLEPRRKPLQRVGQRALGDREGRKLLEGGADLVEGQPVDVLQQQRVGQDLGAQATLGNLIGGRWGGDDLPTATAVVPVALKTRDLDPRRDHVLLEVRRHGDRWPQRPVTCGAPAQPLLDDAVDRGRGGPRHPGMTHLLAGTLETTQEARQVERGTLRRGEPLSEPLNVLLEARDPTLLLVDERHECASGQPLQIGDDGQRPSLSPGLSDTV